nr:hypothetical protein [Tanacetum cinerariifolium]
MDDQENASKHGGGIAELDADKDVTLVDAKEDMTVDDIDEAEHAEVEEVIEVVTAAKLMTEVVTAAATIIIAAHVPKASALRRRKSILIHDPDETSTPLVIVHSEDEAFARHLEAELNANINWNDVVDQVKRKEKGMTYTDIRPIFEKHYNYIQAFLEKRKKEIEEEESKRKSKSSVQRIAKKQRIDEEEEDLKSYLQIVVNDDDDVFTEATPLALKMFLLVERKYPLTRFILKQMLNNVRLEVKEESEMSLDLLRVILKTVSVSYYCQYKVVSVVSLVSAASVVVNTVSMKSKDKGKGILIEEPKPLKRQAQIEQDEAFARHLEAKLNANINWNDVVDQVKRKEKIDEEEEDLKAYLQIVVNDDDDVFTEATPLALKLVQERFQSSELKNFSDNFLLNTLKTMFEKPNVEANIWREQKGIYGLAKVKSWKLFESCGVHIITFKTTQMFLLVEKKYPLTRFILKQMLNNVRLEVEEESEMSLDLLSFGVDAVEDFKEYMLKD